MRSLVRLCLDVLLPRTCPPCGEALAAGWPSALCGACRANLVAPVVPCCERCGRSTGSATACCVSCALRPPIFASARALGSYRPGHPSNTLARTIQHLKYHGSRALAGPLAELLATHYPFAGDAVVVPVPLHVSRLRARGYNQAALLAHGLARHRHLGVDVRLLVRTRATAEHATLGAAARRENVRGAFRARSGARMPSDTVVLVDDVLTTGATADACARALLDAGVRRVDVYTVGRTPGGALVSGRMPG